MGAAAVFKKQNPKYPSAMILQTLREVFQEANRACLSEMRRQKASQMQVG